MSDWDAIIGKVVGRTSKRSPHRVRIGTVVQAESRAVVRPIARRDERKPRDFLKAARTAQPSSGNAEHSGPRATPSSQCVFTRG